MLFRIHPPFVHSTAPHSDRWLQAASDAVDRTTNPPRGNPPIHGKMILPCAQQFQQKGKLWSPVGSGENSDCNREIRWRLESKDNILSLIRKKLVREMHESFGIPSLDCWF